MVPEDLLTTLETSQKALINLEIRPWNEGSGVSSTSTRVIVVEEQQVKGQGVHGNERYESY